VKRSAQFRVFGRRPGAARRSLGIAAGLIAALSLGESRPIAAQSLQPRLPASATFGPCTGSVPLANASPNTSRAQEVLRLGQQSALAGDRTSAREFLAEAVRLDPSNADAAYHHARILEELGDSEAARDEYCRFLSLPVSAPDSAEVSERIAALRPTTSTLSEDVREAFVRGAAYLTANDPRAAERAYDFIVYHHPSVPESYLNRAIARETRGARAGAIRDYREYLRLSPEAADRSAVEDRVHRLAASVPSPGTAATRGLLFPGLGQFSTDRPALGVAALATVAGAGVVATQTRIVTRTGHFEHPFDREDPYTFEYQERVRPYLIAGIAAGAIITIGSAVEAYFHARSVHDAANEAAHHAGSQRSLEPFFASSTSGTAHGPGLRWFIGR
jgi:Tfp pilus assembly protein PilF